VKLSLVKLERFVDLDSECFIPAPKKQQKGDKMKRAIFFISAIIIISSFSSQLLALPEGAVARFGGMGEVNAVTFSPDGKYPAVATSIGVTLLDPFSLAEIYSFDTTASMTSVAFSPDGSLLASGSLDSTIKLWDVRSRTLVVTLEGHSYAVSSIAFSPDGSLLASGSGDKTVKLWDVRSRTLVATLEGHSEYVSSVAFSPDGSLLASGSGDKTVKLWDVRSRTLAATLVHSYVNSVAFSPDGSLLASGCSEYMGSEVIPTVKLWDVRSRTLAATLETYNTVVAFSPDGSLLASGGKLWDVRSRTLVVTLENSYVDSVAFSPDGSLLASIGLLRTRTVKLWDVRSRTLVATLENSYNGVVAFSPDGSLLASGSDYGTVMLWDVRSRTLMATLEGHSSVRSVAFSPDGSLLASGIYNEVRLWDVKSRTLVMTLENSGFVVFSPDGLLLASVSGGTIRLWDVRSKTLVATLEGHSDRVNSVAFSPDGTLLAIGRGFDLATELWDVRSRTLVTTLENSDFVVFSPDGSLFASVSGGTIRLWSVRSRMPVATLEHGGSVYLVAFSPDGSLLASVSGGNKIIKLWDVKSGTLVATLENSYVNYVGFSPDVLVKSVAFSPDGLLLASGSDSEVRLWDVRSRKLVTTLKWHSDSGDRDWAYYVTFSPNGSLLASVSDSLRVKDSGFYDMHKKIRLWDVRSRKLAATLEGPVDSVAFSPDGTVLAGSWEYGTILYDMKPYSEQVPQQPNIVVSDKNYNFNDTHITTHSDWTFTISNAGNSDLKISGIDSDNPAFTVTPMAFPQSVAPGKALDVAVSFNPTDERTYTGILTIKSNDPDSPTITISLEGDGIKNPKAMQYYISSPSNEKDRGGLIIPSDTFPEGKGSVIPIYVPSIVDGSNKIIEDTAWKTIKEINKAKLNFEWEKMLANFNFEGADTPTESAFSAIAGLIEAVNKAISISVCNIIIQKDSGGNFRAIIQVGDPDRRTFIRKYAGGGVIDPLAEAFWLVQAAFSDQIAKTFSLEPDNYPSVYYTMTINIDALHKDDSYIGYLSLSDKGKIVMTPKVYPKDELKIIRFHQFIIPYKKETVLALSGDGYINFMEGPAEPGFIKMLTPSLSESAIVVQGRSPIEIRVYDSKERVTGLVKGKIKEDIPESIYDEVHKIAIILSPTDVYRYEIVGTDNGEYGLEVTSIKGKESNTFTATNVPTSPNAVHEYSVDWNALSNDTGVTINIDSNGDGKIDETINSGASFIGYNCDVNSDGVVNILDLVIISKNFGKSAPDNAKADVNKDGIVDILDLNIVVQHFGEVYK